MSEPQQHEDCPAYQDGYEDACKVTNDLLGTLMEDVEKYQQAYLRMLKQYHEHMTMCSVRKAGTP